MKSLRLLIVMLTVRQLLPQCVLLSVAPHICKMLLPVTRPRVPLFLTIEVISRFRVGAAKYCLILTHRLTPQEPRTSLRTKFGTAVVDDADFQ